MSRKKLSNPVAVVCARGLGDALLSMILTNNLYLSGEKVVIFSTILCEMKSWFPHHTILPFPLTENLHKTFSSFGTIIAADCSLLNEHHNFGNHLIILKECNFDKRRSMVDNLQSTCKNQLALPVFSKENGMVAPKDLKWRAHPKRVLIHPMSNEPKKNWTDQKFIQLSKHIEDQGFSTYICVSPTERELWEPLLKEEQFPFFPTVDELARFVYESGYLIGNDSGLGHLASILKIPTLSLFEKKSYSHLWRPGWGPGKVVTARKIPVFSRLRRRKLRERYWKQALSVKRVLQAFNDLIT